MIHCNLKRVEAVWTNNDPPFFHPSQVIILDVRVPCTPVARLNNHRACVNGIGWAPHSSCHICTAGELVHLLTLGQEHRSTITFSPLLNRAEEFLHQGCWVSDIGYNNCYRENLSFFIRCFRFTRPAIHSDSFESFKFFHTNVVKF